jgi:hypothetical protein
MKHHDRYSIAASFLLGAFVLNALTDMGWLNSVAESGLMDWAAWILGTAGILFYFFAIREHHRSHR